MTRVIAGLGELRTLVGQALGTSEWLNVDQARIDAFADATEDRQWIHVDPARAADGPYGATIAHGYLTLSLLPRLSASTYRVEGIVAAINYGSDRVRYPASVPVGSRLRATIELLEITEVAGGVQSRTRATVECDKSARPVLVAEVLTRMLK